MLNDRAALGHMTFGQEEVLPDCFVLELSEWSATVTHDLYRTPRHTSKGSTVTILDLQDGHRQQRYIDHLEGEVERLQQLLQVRPAECGTAASHQRRHVITHASGPAGFECS
jgi:hypothetical protein